MDQDTETPESSRFRKTYVEALEISLKNPAIWGITLFILFRDYTIISKITSIIFIIFVAGPLLVSGPDEIDEGDDDEDVEEIFRGAVIDFSPPEYEDDNERHRVSVESPDEKEHIGWVDGNGLYVLSAEDDTLVQLTTAQLRAIIDQCDLIKVTGTDHLAD